MEAQVILGNCELTLNDPNGAYWNTASDPLELLGYLNQFCQWAIGLKPDLGTARQVVNLTAGINQRIPATGMQFLDADFAGNGQSVFLREFEELKHSKFSNLANTTPVDNVTTVCADPRDPRDFYCWPPSTGASASTLQIRFAQYIMLMTEPTNTYPLGDETSDPAYWYVLALAFRKTCDRQDLDRAAVCYNNALQWFGLRTQAQFGEDGKED
jgi:hypothetical protein